MSVYSELNFYSDCGSKLLNATIENTLIINTPLITVNNLLSTNSSVSNLIGTNGTIQSLLITDTILVDGTLNVSTGNVLINNVDITPSPGDLIKETCITLANNVQIPTIIPGFAFDNQIVRSFEAMLSSSIITTTGGDDNQFSHYSIKGLQTDRFGDDKWCLNTNRIGDPVSTTSNLEFSINQSGQLLYTSSNISNFDHNKVCFRALTTSK